MDIYLASISDPPRIVLGDANVFYARVFRDYLLYAASTGIISITWSEAILDEVISHLIRDVKGFTAESGTLLKQLMNEAYPLAQIDPTADDLLRLSGIFLPDEGDRHVLAAALAAEADILCTANTKDFPAEIVSAFGIEVLSPDELLCALISSFPDKMLIVHQMTVKRLPGSTNETTVAALRAAGAPLAAEAMRELQGLNILA